jgi:hypothetical protein
MKKQIFLPNQLLLIPWALTGADHSKQAGPKVIGKGRMTTTRIIILVTKTYIRGWMETPHTEKLASFYFASDEECSSDFFLEKNVITLTIMHEKI